MWTFIAFCIIQFNLLTCQEFNSVINDHENNKGNFLSQLRQSVTCGPYFSLTKSQMNCVVNMDYAEYVNNNNKQMGIEGCHKSWNNNFIINVNNLIKNVSFECTSNTPLDIKIYFEDEATIVHYTTVTRERVVEDYEDVRKYLYKLKIHVPTFPLVYGLKKKTMVVKYKILEIGNAPANINALFYILQDNENLENNTVVHWMKEDSTVIAVDEIINIPCISLSEKMWLFHLQDGIWRVIEEGVRYDLLNGLLVETQYLPDFTSEFMCSVFDILEGGIEIDNKNIIINWKNSTVKYKAFPFRITLPQDLLVEPVTTMGVTNPEDYYDLQRKQEPFVFRCSRQSRNVSMNLHWAHESGNVQVKINHKLLIKPEQRFEVTAVLSHLPADDCLTDWTEINCRSDTIYLECVDPETNVRLAFWNIRTRRTIDDEENEWFHSSEFFYDFGERNFKCSPINSGSVKEISLRHMACENEFQCRELSKCLHYVGTNDDDADVGHSVCISAETTFARTPCQPLDKDNDQSLCNVAKPLVSNKGNLQCLIERTEYNEFLLETYFEGFNGELYGNYRNDIPLNAILQLIKYHDTNEPYNTMGKFMFRCDAHPFTFEQGLVWLFNHTMGNGSFVKQIPSEYISYIPDSINSHFSSNIHSIVEITFPEESITEVICAAPRMYSKVKWASTSVNVIVKKSIAPNITSDNDLPKYFKVGQTGQSVTCKAEGFPIPKIIWTINGTEIDEDDSENSDLEVLDKVLQKVLLFSKYDESFAGDYACTASNILDNVTKIFSIRTLKEEQNSSSSVNLIWVSFGLALFVIITIAVLYCYFRRLRNKRKQEMKEIVDLLNGSSDNLSQEENEYEDPVTLFPYDKKYELKRDSFSVDDVLLGKGNYSLVYKGRVQEVDGLCAFKTLPTCYTMSELRSLVYELKILSYIGKQENIVQLVGAFTKHIFEGKIYIVTQLCALGSLEGYLSSNRATFIENITKDRKNYWETDNLSICTFQRLLIWSKQIANALEYIWSKRVLHGDIATRNVLLTADGVAKVTDFGLSRTLDKNDQYIKQNNNDVLPWQWLAIECMRDQPTYSVHSDVWAYGITLWEIFTLGNVPYPEIEPPKVGSILFWKMFSANLESGLQNKIPQYASPQIYEIMKSCWEIEPKSRPSFSSLKDSFQSVIKDWRQHNDKVKMTIDCESNLRKRFTSTQNNMNYNTLGVIPDKDICKLTDDQNHAIQNGYVLHSLVDKDLPSKDITTL